MAADAPPQAETHPHAPAAEPPRVATGIVGLDVVLGGGVLRRQLYVIEGAAGTGKTTLALHFLLAGRAHGERCLWLTTTETPDELRAAAHAYGWSLEGVTVLALPMVDRLAQPDQRQTLFRPAHIELDETMQEILTALEQVQPERVVLDSLAILRDMADDSLAYRRQVLALKQALRARGCTALLTDEVAEPSDLHVRTLAHGVVRLLREVTTFGNQQRQVEIVKMRGMTWSSRPAASRCFHGSRRWCLPGRSPSWWSRPESRPWIRRWAAAWIVAPRRCWSARRVLASPR
jgi:circadian clock protein KaiC